ncbi:RloB-like protein [Streptoalloteichus tenebrarius]|uniref:RloB-like protein n=1 Tax=Streptoalloteichus tenebrarius (strain ATCC 17920 / DSM 40477 / JCM 4838 / CBS 697.72 / NBRC 16177 / NCIMB 11028 / NRRL B-12390 / A12253. 1 / ISP 5477) TaxID=1933 RepID=A0ABT1HN46_STRSD|nr:RloB-like protein [Streptoalloteichus tenebrarius]
MVRRENSQHRNTRPRRQPASRVLIVSCGERTELDYFDGLRRSLKPPTVALAVKPKKASPDQLVAYARKLREQDPGGFDEVWCVMDVDHYDLEGAISAAREGGVVLAISNPCFEVWLLLHFVACASPFSNEKAVRDALRRHVPGYKKNNLDFAVFQPHVMDAIERAKNITPAHGQAHTNPSTGVWRLVEVVLDRDFRGARVRRLP